MQKVLILKGLPASGKSTFAKQLVAQKGSKWKRINKDDLRSMLDNGQHSSGKEKYVIKARNLLLGRALQDGYDVIIDDTNLNPVHEQDIRDYVPSVRQNVKIEVKFFDIDVEEAIKRDLARPVSVGEHVIRRMYNEYLKPRVEVYVAPAGAPKAILCDIDGTLAHMTKEGRLRFGKQAPYMWLDVGEDTVDKRVRDTLQRYAVDTKIIIVSGRDSICRPHTEKWLKDNNVPYDALFMRPQDDNRKDNIIKRELFDTHIRGVYDVWLVLDDRNQVVNEWRDMGLTCWQVAPGDF